MQRAGRSSWHHESGSWRLLIGHDDVSSGTCTTAPSSGWCQWRFSFRKAQAAMPPRLAAQLDTCVVGLDGALDELREFARGIHPPILAEGGLGPALRASPARSAVPVEIALGTTDRLPESVEIAAYYVVSEALTNATKHAHAKAIGITVEPDAEEHVLHIAIRDDGVGGADFTHGTGLVGLKDRVEALSGRILLDSPPGAGTRLRAELPISPTKYSVTPS